MTIGRGVAAAFAIWLTALMWASVATAQHDHSQSSNAPALHGQHSTGQPTHGHENKGEASHDSHGPPKPINWFYGWFGKDDGAEPSFLWRKSDMDAPFFASVLNFVVFAWVVYRFGRKPVQEGLARRKESIMREIDQAQKMKREAEERLSGYEKRLQHIDDEIDRIRREFREQGEREKERILHDAEEKRERMLKDAAFLIEQETKQMRLTLLRETVETAVHAAEEALRTRITSDDHERLAQEYLRQLAARGSSASKRGQA